MPQRVSLKSTEHSDQQPGPPGPLRGRGVSSTPPPSPRSPGREATDRGRDSQEGSKRLTHALPTSRGRQETCCPPATKPTPGQAACGKDCRALHPAEPLRALQHRTRCTYAHRCVKAVLKLLPVPSQIACSSHSSRTAKLTSRRVPTPPHGQPPHDSCSEGTGHFSERCQGKSRLSVYVLHT